MVRGSCLHGVRGNELAVRSVAGQARAEHRWRVLADVPTSLGARTALWYPERDLLYAAAPGTCSSQARLLVFHGRSN